MAPFSWLYGLVLHLRHTLYDDHLLPSHSVSVPTICVGNLAVGGTGKTPHTEWLVRHLGKHYKLAVLSRGYGRRTHGFILADHNSTARTIGDEPMQIHRKFPDVPVAVCADRVKGIRQLQRMVPDLQLVILDDALQHRSIKCGFNILLTAQNNLYIDDRLLPYGTLRDIKHRSHAAHAVIVTKCPEIFKPIDKRVIDNRLHLATFQQLYFSKMVYETALDSTQKPLVVSGIANPEEFFEHVKKTCPKAELLAFGDHHRFTKRDIARIEKAAAKHDIVLTTEKDYERLQLTTLPERLGAKLQVVPIHVKIDETHVLEKQLTTYIDEALRNSGKSAKPNYSKA